MKALFSFSGILLAFFSSFPGLDAQPGTYENGFLLKLLLPDGSTPLFENKEGGYGHATFGAEVLQEIEGEVAWARTAAGDSICCAPVSNDLTGKIALIRRGGTCSFSQKCFFAQKNGAKAVIVLNHYNLPADDENTIVNMQGSTNADSVNIPCIFVCRKVGELITDAVDNGQQMTVRFIFRSLDKATAAYHYATPKSQVDTLKHIAVHFFNHTFDTLHDATVNAKITEPGGNIVNLSVPVSSLVPKQDTLLFFPPYLPPAELGNFEVLFSNSVFGDSEDTVKRRFSISEYYWASDNGAIVPGGLRIDGINNQILWLQYGALYRTGNISKKAAYVTFGLANAAEVYSPLGDDANSIGLLLYDADSDGNGEVNLVNTWDDLVEDIAGYSVYVINGNETPDSLINWPLMSINNNGMMAELKPLHWYYVALFYDGAEAGTFILPAFSKTAKENYVNFPSTPIEFNSASFLDEGFENYTVVQRLREEIFDIDPITTRNILDPSKYIIAPNPASDFIQLDLRLATISPKITASLLDGWGRRVTFEKRVGFQEGVISFDVKNLPSGAYLLWIRTEEGSAMRKVMICH